MAMSSPPLNDIPLNLALGLIDQMITILVSDPSYSASLIDQLSSLCVVLKKVGHLVDEVEDNKKKLDIMQTLLTKLCKDKNLDIFCRLEVLEVIELRTSNWVRKEREVSSSPNLVYSRADLLALAESSLAREAVQIRDSVSNGVPEMITKKKED